MSAPPTPGQVVRVRSRRWLVERVEPARDLTRVELSCIEDGHEGKHAELLWEVEIDAKIVSQTGWDVITERGFDDPARFAAYLYTLSWGCLTAADTTIFQAPYRAGIDVMNYQLEAVRKALELPRVNLFIADDVGLGKTIEAGLIMREMLIRKKLSRIVAAVPPSVVWQWKQEMETRFGLTFQIMDREYIRRKRQEMGFATNPFATHTRFLISHALIRDERYAGLLRDWLGEFSEGSMLVLDEAHHAAPATSSKYAVDSKFTRTVRDLVGRFEHRLFLSATPHNGHSNSFSALLELLDPQRFTRGVPIKSARELEPVMVRRLKSDLMKHTHGDSGGFPTRVVVPIEIDDLPADAPELELANLLQDYREVRIKLHVGDKKRQRSQELVLTSLQKRLHSSVAAFARTLAVHKRALDKRRDAAEATRLDVSGIVRSGELDAGDDELDELEDRAVALGTGQVTSKDADALLERMTRIAARASQSPESKVERIVEWIGQNQCEGVSFDEDLEEREKKGAWNGRRLIVFTEYADSLYMLRRRLEEAIAGTQREGERIGVYHGGMGEESREEVKIAFNSSPDDHPLRILLATDAAREGVNLQNHCADLIHFDIPWNPARMEQRNGRIDRKLQRSPEVRCHYFVLTQRPEDRVLDALVRKTDTIQRELGSLSQVIHGELAESLSSGIRREAIDAHLETIEGADKQDARQMVAQRELEQVRQKRDTQTRESLERLRAMLERSKRYLGFDHDHFRNTLSQALGLLGLAPLERTDDGMYVFPDLEEHLGRDLSWRHTVDTLRRPRRPREDWREWRASAPLRPVIFQDAGMLDADRVHLHLEHPLARRLLALFGSQGFADQHLSRGTVVFSDSSVPRVVLVGRLSLYGPGASRLHTELVLITAPWREWVEGAEPLKGYKRSAERATLDALRSDLKNNASIPVPANVLGMLGRQAPRDVEELLGELEARFEEAAEAARAKLVGRGEKEAGEMADVLTRQRKAILEQQREFDDQGLLLFDAKEKRQIEADRKAWRERLGALDEELSSEPGRIKNMYEVKLARREPVGLVYLWPRSG